MMQLTMTRSATRPKVHSPLIRKAGPDRGVQTRMMRQNEFPDQYGEAMTIFVETMGQKHERFLTNIVEKQNRMGPWPRLQQNIFSCGCNWMDRIKDRYSPVRQSKRAGRRRREKTPEKFSTPTLRTSQSITRNVLRGIRHQRIISGGDAHIFVERDCAKSLWRQ